MKKTSPVLKLFLIGAIVLLCITIWQTSIDPGCEATYGGITKRLYGMECKAALCAQAATSPTAKVRCYEFAGVPVPKDICEADVYSRFAGSPTELAKCR